MNDRLNPAKTSTPASQVIDAHYARKRINKVWDFARVERLCGFLKVTQYELASMLNLRHFIFDSMLRREPNLRGPTALLLSILEARYLEGYAPDIIKDIFNYGSPGHTEEDEHDASSTKASVHGKNG